MDLINLKQQFLQKIAAISNLKELEILELEYFGREKGLLTEILRNLKNLSEDERKKIGEEANRLKQEIQNLLSGKKEEFKEKEKQENLKKEWIDITAPGKKISRGSLHPLTKTIKEITRIFHNMGFAVAEGPDIETEFYNFDALNIPSDHPARDMWDTFWIKNPESKFQITNRKLQTNYKSQITNSKQEKLLLRAHTSPVQIRYMMTHNPPFRIIAPGRVFRYEATDASHSHTFYQLEGLMVGEDVNIANFKAVIQEFFNQFFKKEVKVRLRPSYFPFVEPGFEIDISCNVCGENGCSVCKNSGLVELAGAGMVHRNVFKSVGYNPEMWQGFAFGFGIDRIAMMKYKIPDIRLFYSNDLRFLKQF